MPIDPSDIVREETRRQENRRSATHRESGQKESARNFAAQLQTKIRKKESEPTRTRDLKDEGAKESDPLFHRVLTAFHDKEEGAQEQKKDRLQKEKDKRDKLKEERVRKEEVRSESHEGHERVAAKKEPPERQAKDEGSGRENRDGRGGHSDDRQSAGGGTGSFSGGSERHPGRESDRKAPSGPFASSGPRIRPAAAFRQSRESSSGQKRFSEKNLDEIVSAVSFRINERREEEMEISLSDEFFSGLAFKAIKGPQGLILTFRCPTKEVRDLFLLERPAIYRKLAEKKIGVARIDVVM